MNTIQRADAAEAGVGDPENAGVDHIAILIGDDEVERDAVDVLIGIEHQRADKGVPAHDCGLIDFEFDGGASARNRLLLFDQKLGLCQKHVILELVVTIEKLACSRVRCRQGARKALEQRG